MKKVHICDYGVGNIRNVEHAFKKIGAQPVLCQTADQMTEAETMVIPGVGAFGDCINRFRDKGFEEVVKSNVASGIPLLGVCVGMQMLATRSDEFGVHLGLDIIPGEVKRISIPGDKGKEAKLPHISWSPLNAYNATWAGTPFAKTEPGDEAYFVHSYAMNCDNPEHILATFEYGGQNLVAAVHCDNVFGVQFHPEKSADVGLKILNNYLHLNIAN